MRSLQPFYYLTALLMLTCTTSFAQQTIAKSSKATHTSFTTQQHTTVETGGTAIVQPSMKTEQTFLKQFPEATGVQWRQLAENYYISFLNGDQKASTVLSPKGIIKYTVTNCTINQLPKVLQTKIAKYYDGYAFVSALQINAHDAVAHEVILQNEKDYLKLKSTEDGVEVLQTITKTNVQH